MIRACAFLRRNVSLSPLQTITLDKTRHHVSQWLRRHASSKNFKRNRSRVLVSFKSMTKIPDLDSSAKLSPQQVTSILELEQRRFDIQDGAVKSVDINRLAANDPIEDRDGYAKLAPSKFLFGVYDGHGGCWCSSAVSERLFHYIAISLASYDILEDVMSGNWGINNLVNWFQKETYSEISHRLYQRAILRYAQESLAAHEPSSVEQHLKDAFLRLDHDIIQEAIPSGQNKEFNTDSLLSAMAGSCATLSYIDDTALYVANLGDCRAVLGVNIQDSEYIAVPLSNTHDAQNASEIRRILDKHKNESSNIIKNNRLFGELAPLRAFGDIRYKVSLTESKDLERYFNSPTAEIRGYYDNKVVPPNYKTPPYLISEPEVIRHNLTPKDKFLVIASDGLFDMLSPDKVVKLVAGHINGKQILIDPQIDTSMNLREMNQYLVERKTKLANRSIDDNAATHLIRNALGPEHRQISYYLSLPDQVCRTQRDDMTVAVIFFDGDYIRNKSSVRA
ncbi:pyruvate dehydrogenase [acetyl-transferring]-phosphatase 1, mitochondrial-like [Ostrea edulis]|uniref:pyruvate dehydrogenase [acetyl-transferring]-phosphatase 1, mitochondrial-like n=1 Tax=Ostrea edulis TaxID=37623 RepID=UPI0024AF6796|nr:pyruvate dehydrogenase [acetyl-transferring]-phosphatase 1, mitochondrial-like [Ostrea edulis]